MKRISRNLIVCSAFLSICSAANLAYARGEGGAGAAAAAAGAAGMRAGLSAIAAKAQTTGVAADDAANAGLPVTQVRLRQLLRQLPHPVSCQPYVMAGMLAFKVDMVHIKSVIASISSLARLFIT